MPIKTSTGKWKWGNIERNSKKELVQTVYGIWKKNGSKGTFSDFWHGNHKMNEDKYEPPWTLDQIRRNVPDKYDELSKDPVHKWRAETGIELIHKEPSKDELDRIWKNWQLMDDEMKAISDKKSKELFGISNREHYMRLSKEDGIGNSFKSYLSEDESEEILTIDEGNLGKVQNKDLRMILKWLFDNFGERSNKKVIDSIEFVGRIQSDWATARVIATTKFAGHNERKRLGFEIMSALEDGPLVFVSKPIEQYRKSDHVKFLYYTNLDKDVASDGTVEGFLSGAKDKFQMRTALPKDLKFYKNAIRQDSPSKRKFSLSVYDVSVEDLRGYFSNPIEVAEGREAYYRMDLKRVFQLDFTIPKIGNIDFGSNRIKNSADFLEPFVKFLGNGIGMVNGDEYVINVVPLEKYPKMVESSRKTLEKLSIDESSGEYALFFSMFEILFGERSDDSKDFDMDKLRNTELTPSSGNFSEITFGAALSLSKGLGAYVSELLIPMLLVKGVESIGGKQIIIGMDPTDKVVSVEWPRDSTNGLTDYDVVFANTAQGKRFAISAKFEEGNKPSLIRKMADYSGTFDGFSEEFKQLMNVSKDYWEKYGKHRNNYITRSIWEMAKLLKLDFGVSDFLTYDEVNDEVFDRPVGLRQTIRKKYPRKEQGKVFDYLIKKVPYSLTVLFEKTLTRYFNSKPELLKDVYNMIFNYYPDAIFQQIELSKDLNLKYISKKDETRKANVGELIEIVNLGSAGDKDGRKLLNQSTVLGIHLL